MSKKYFLLGLMLCLLIIPINAETLTGTIGGSGSISDSYNQEGGLSPQTTIFTYLTTSDIAQTDGLSALIYFNTYSTFGGDANSPSGATTPVTIKRRASCPIGAPTETVIGTGTIGYQRLFNGEGTQITGGYAYLTMDTWEVSSFTGAQCFVAEYNRAGLYNTTVAPGANTGYNERGIIGFTDGYFGNTYALKGSYTMNRAFTTSAEYTVEKPKGLGIEGSLTKIGFSKVFVSDENHRSIAAESTYNTDDFGFGTNASTIYLSLYSSIGGWFNSSLLFGTELPTPTLTPTPIPTGIGYTPTSTQSPLDFSNVTLRFYGETNQALSGVYVEYYYPQGSGGEWNARLEGYTNSSGMIDFFMVEKTYSKIKAYKSGYAIREYYVTPANAIHTYNINMIQDINNVVPANIDLTIITRSYSGVALSDTYVTYYDQILGGGGAQYTNATGMTTFYNIPNTAYIAGQLTKSGYVSRTYSLGYQPLSDVTLTLYMDAGSHPITGQPTPVPITPYPTPVSYDTVSLSANPSSVAVNEQVTLTAACSNVTACTGAGGGYLITYYYRTSSDASNVFIGQYRYNSTSTKWDYRASSGATQFTVGDFTQLVQEHTPDQAETYTYSVFISKTGFVSIGNAWVNVLVGGGGGVGGLTMTLYASDGATTSHVSNYAMNITSEESGIVTDLGTISYDVTRLLPRGSHYELQCSKSGYIDGSFNFVVPIDQNCEAGDFCSYAKCPLYPIGSIIASNTSVTIQASDVETYYPLGNVKISVSVDGVTTEKYTGSNGESVIFNIPYNKDYSIVASKAAYCADSEWKNTGTEQYQYVGMSLKYGACAGATATPTPTATPLTPTVTPTLYGGYGNASIGEPAVCGSLPPDANMIDTLVQGLACNGFETKESQNMAMSVLIILFCGIILGRIARGIGVLSGVIIGAVISMAMGMLPIWIIIVIIILAGLIFAGRIFWSSGGGQ